MGLRHLSGSDLCALCSSTRRRLAAERSTALHPVSITDLRSRVPDDHQHVPTFTRPRQPVVGDSADDRPGSVTSRVPADESGTPTYVTWATGGDGSLRGRSYRRPLILSGLPRTSFLRPSDRSTPITPGRLLAGCTSSSTELLWFSQITAVVIRDRLVTGAPSLLRPRLHEHRHVGRETWVGSWHCACGESRRSAGGLTSSVH